MALQHNCHIDHTIKIFSATEAFVVNFPRTCHKQEGQKLVVQTAQDAKIVFERRHEVVALHEQLGRGDVENSKSSANETGRTAPADVILSNFFRLLYCLDGSYLVLPHTVTSTIKSMYWTSGPPRFSVVSKSRACRCKNWSRNCCAGLVTLGRKWDCTCCRKW